MEEKDINHKSQASRMVQSRHRSPGAQCIEVMVLISVAGVKFPLENCREAFEKTG